MGLGFEVWGLGVGVWGFGVGALGFEFRVSVVEFGIWGLGAAFLDLELGVWGLGFGVWGLGFGVYPTAYSHRSVCAFAGGGPPPVGAPIQSRTPTMVFPQPTNENALRAPVPARHWSLWGDLPM